VASVQAVGLPFLRSLIPPKEIPNTTTHTLLARAASTNLAISPCVTLPHVVASTSANYIEYARLGIASFVLYVL
jgi:hypothetical protein